MIASKLSFTEVARATTRAGLGLALGIGLVAGIAGSAGAAPIASHYAAGANPRTDGTTVVYQTEANPPADWDITGATLANHTPFAIATGPAQSLIPDVSGDVVVWQELNADGDYDIIARHLSGGSSFTLAGGPRQEVDPDISGGWVAYVSAPKTYTEGATQTLQAVKVDLNGGKKLDEAPVGGGSGGFLRPAMSGQRVAWFRLEQTGDHVVHWQLKLQRLNENNATVLAQGDLDIGGPLGALSAPSVDIAGDTLVYAVDLRLNVINLVTGEQHELASPSAATFRTAQNPTTDGRYVFWQDERRWGTVNDIVGNFQSGKLNADIYGYDLASDSEFLAVPGTAFNINPYTRGGILTWEQHATSGSGDPHIYAQPIAQLLPTTPRPDSGDPNALYFPETGHALTGAFRDFWQRSGGLPVFGYPMTEVFSDHGYVAQFLERQRFEAFPEFDGTPYAIQLGLLGVEDAQHRDLIGSAPFQPLPASTGSDVNCTFYPQTGHRLCNGFKGYWRAHGLEFGDPGISERESLALFGYPISEEFVDPDTGLVTQYFERARFEYHPENAEPYMILLGRLAADVLSARGW